MCILFIFDLQWIAKIKIKSGRGFGYTTPHCPAQPFRNVNAWAWSVLPQIGFREVHGFHRKFGSLLLQIISDWRKYFVSLQCHTTEWLSVSNIFTHGKRGGLWQDIQIDESVFALSLQENVVVFKESKDNDSTSSVFAWVYCYTIDTGVGIVSVYLLSGLTTTFLKIGGSTPHFFAY